MRKSMAVSYPLEFTQAPVTSGILAALFVNDFLALAIRQRPSSTVFFRAGPGGAAPYWGGEFPQYFSDLRT
jgi:hypothetical protein